MGTSTIEVAQQRIQELDRLSAATVYQVQPSYQRFNQKYNMTRQRLWNPKEAELGKQRDIKRLALIAARQPGYEPLDVAFSMGASANVINSGFDVNSPNQRGNSWQPRRRGNLPERVVLLPEKASAAIRRVARLAGADVVSFARLDRRWVYSHYYDVKTKQDYPIHFSDEPGFEHCTQPIQLDDGTQVIPATMQYVVVLIFEMDERGIAAAPTLTQNAATQLTYAQIGFTALALAEFIRGLGYHAIPSANCTALNIPLAIDAGLGQLGRHAKLITPQFGPRCRIAKVITDLPVIVRQPIGLGITEFCDVCLKCAQKCPSRAIPFGERSFEPVNECNSGGVLQWQVDHHKCAEYQAQVGTNCGICLRVCPFNKGKGKIHDTVRWVIRNVKPLDPAIVRLDDLLGYGRFVDPHHFWDA